MLVKYMIYNHLRAVYPTQIYTAVAIIAELFCRDCNALVSILSLT